MAMWGRCPIWLRTLVYSVTAFFTTIAAVAGGLPIVEPFFPAHRSYVRDTSNDDVAKLRRELAPTKLGVYDIQIQIAKSRRSAIFDQIFQLEIDVTKSDSPEELVKRRSQLQKLKDELVSLDSEIKLLAEQREKN